MKKLLVSKVLLSAVLASSILPVAAFANEVETSNSANSTTQDELNSPVVFQQDDNKVTPQIKYDNIAIPTFSIKKDEVVFNTRNGNYYTLEAPSSWNPGSWGHESSLDLSFTTDSNDNGTLLAAAVRSSDYINNKSKVQQNPTGYAVAYRSISGNGSHQVTFSDIGPGTFVVMFVGQKGNVSVKNGMVSSH